MRRCGVCRRKIRGEPSVIALSVSSVARVPASVATERLRSPGIGSGLSTAGRVWTRERAALRECSGRRGRRKRARRPRRTSSARARRRIGGYARLGHARARLLPQAARASRGRPLVEGRPRSPISEIAENRGLEGTDGSSPYLASSAASLPVRNRPNIFRSASAAQSGCCSEMRSWRGLNLWPTQAPSCAGHDGPEHEEEHHAAREEEQRRRRSSSAMPAHVECPGRGSSRVRSRRYSGQELVESLLILLDLFMTTKLLLG